MSTYDQVVTAISTLESKVIGNLQDLNNKQRELSDEVFSLKQRGAFNGGGMDDTRTPANLGAAVSAKFNALRETYEATKSVSFKVPFETKALVSTTGATYAVQSHESVPGHAYVMQPDTTLLLAALPSRPLGGVSTAHYSRFISKSGAVAVQAGEGAQKAEVSPDFTPIAQNAITVAGWTPITEQAMRTSGELEIVVNSFLVDQIRKGVDTVLIGGTAVVEWPFAGLKALAAAYPSATYTEMADTIAEVVAHMRWQGMNPNVVVLNAMEYLGLVLAKNLGGDYLTGSYLADVPLIVHGCRVVFNSGISVGEALVLDTRFIELGMSSELDVTVGHNSDDFVKNKRTIRAEVSIIPIFRHAHAARLATPYVAP